jgi:hypothetical protein
MSECGYPNYYGEEDYACTRPLGHEGLHGYLVEWETRPIDICKAEGHVWGEWEPYSRTRPNMFVHIREWKIDPEAWRRCSRCKSLDFKGGERNKDLSDVLFEALYRRLAGRVRMEWMP